MESALEQHVTNLTEQWISLISGDHHKDKDCHFYINKVWSYGEAPYFSVEHYGYLVAYTNKTKFKTYKEALYSLAFFLEESIKEWNGLKQENTASL